MFDGEPLWFPTDELLTSLLHAEASAVMQLLAKSPDLPNLFDTPDPTVAQRNACFVLLAHRKIIDMILDMFAGRQEQPALNDVESHTLRCTYNLVADDAPAWALEMQRVIERLPAHIYASLPEPLRSPELERLGHHEVAGPAEEGETLRRGHPRPLFTSRKKSLAAR